MTDIDFTDALAVLKMIAEMTDADNPESYRSDDREGCLDTVHDLAKNAISAIQALGRDVL